MDLLFRIAVYVPVLFLIAIVVVAQNHADARGTLQEAVKRTGRWVWWSFLLVAIMLAIEYVFIGF